MTLGNPILGNGLDHINLEEIKKDLGPPPWSHPVVLTDHITGVVIYQDSGETLNDWHCHNYDEWWVVLEKRNRLGRRGTGRTDSGTGR